LREATRVRPLLA